jgi:hypothetical protein
MAITEAWSGTEAVSTTEWSCTTDTSYTNADLQTDDGVFQGFFDVNDMVAGDQLQIRVYEKCRSGDTERIVYEAILTGQQPFPLFVTPSLVLMHGYDWTLDALAGTITVLWSIRKVA